MPSWLASHSLSVIARMWRATGRSITPIWAANCIRGQESEVLGRGNRFSRSRCDARPPQMTTSILDQFRLDGQSALVVGGNRGLGFEMAKALAEAGASVFIAARDAARNEQARAFV